MVRLTPRKPEIPAKGGFTKENDLFDLKPFGENLANMVESLEEPLVLLLDGPWGSGKTIFVEQWCGLLRERKIPVINFDAFANDYSEDAFTAIAGEILDFAEKNSNLTEETKTRFIETTKKIGSFLLPLAIKAALRSATIGLVSANDIEFGDELQSVAEDAADDLSALSEELIQERLVNAARSRGEIERFREELSSLATEHADNSGGSSQKPLVIVIDELDRCRPSFAINVLERIKHFFSVEGICFVLVTHREQLETAIKGSYGAEFDSSTYLQKFFQLQITLPRDSGAYVEHSKMGRYVEYLWNALDLGTEDQYRKRTCNGLANLAEGHSMQLRDVEHIMSSLAVFIASTEATTFRPDPLVVVLSLMRLKAPELFDKCVQGNIHWTDVSGFIDKPHWAYPESNRDWYLEWWRGSLDETWNDSHGTRAKEYLRRQLSQYRLSSATNAIQWIAKVLEDIRFPSTKKDIE